MWEELGEAGMALQSWANRVGVRAALGRALSAAMAWEEPTSSPQIQTCSQQGGKDDLFFRGGQEQQEFPVGMAGWDGWRVFS